MITRSRISACSASPLVVDRAGGVGLVSCAAPARWLLPADRTVALADYKGANPTGVPASLAQ